jgi:hypothetical protein
MSETRGRQRLFPSKSNMPTKVKQYEPELIERIEMYKGEMCVVMHWVGSTVKTWELLADFLTAGHVSCLIQYLENGGDPQVIPSTWVGWPQWHEAWESVMSEDNDQEEWSGRSDSSSTPRCQRMNNEGTPCTQPLPCTSNDHRKRKKPSKTTSATEPTTSLETPKKTKTTKKPKKSKKSKKTKEAKAAKKPTEKILSYAARINPTSSEASKSSGCPQSDQMATPSPPPRPVSVPSSRKSLTLKASTDRPIVSSLAGALDRAEAVQRLARSFREGILTPDVASHPSLHHDGRITSKASPVASIQLDLTTKHKVHPFTPPHPHTHTPIRSFATHRHSSTPQVSSRSKRGRRSVMLAPLQHSPPVMPAPLQHSPPSAALAAMSALEYAQCVTEMHGSVPSFKRSSSFNPCTLESCNPSLDHLVPFVRYQCDFQS